MSKNTVERFSNRVENYVKYRPVYPKEVLRLFREEMNLQTASIIADIGSGTGISSRLFLENGNQVFGVEPNVSMRRAAESFLRDFPNFRSIDGTAENTTLEDESVDFIVAAQAFHWFETEGTRREFKRILKNKGFISLIWNERQLDSTDFLEDYERFLIEYGVDYAAVRHENIERKVLRSFFRADFGQAVFQNAQTLDFNGLKGRMLSSSYMPSEENPRFSKMLENLKSLFAQHEENGKIEILYDTKVFYAQI